MRAGVVMHHMAGIVTKMNMKTIMKMSTMMTAKATTSEHLQGMKVKMNMMKTMKKIMKTMRITTMTKIDIKGLHPNTKTKMSMMMKTMAMNVEEIQATVHKAHQVTGHVDLHRWIVKKFDA